MCFQNIGFITPTFDPLLKLQSFDKVRKIPFPKSAENWIFELLHAHENVMNSPTDGREGVQ